MKLSLKESVSGDVLFPQEAGTNLEGEIVVGRGSWRIRRAHSREEPLLTDHPLRLA